MTDSEVEDNEAEGNPKTLTPGPRTATTNRVRGLPYGPVHGLPLRTPSTDHPNIV